ncbi:MAG: histidine phosphatase family protein [Proteobacteria bacterium]|nr:histidine phosphatase family protein [Pseudomonadota bacterium]
MIFKKRLSLNLGLLQSGATTNWDKTKDFLSNDISGVGMKTFIKVYGFFFMFLTQSLWAIQEKHLIIIRHGEAQHNLSHEYNSNPNHPHYKQALLTDKGQEQIREAAQLLLTYGFDNRNVAAVYVSPLPRTLASAQIMAQIGVFSQDKIHLEPRLIENRAGDREGLITDKFTKDAWLVGPNEAKVFHAESNEDVRKRVLALYDDIVKQHKDAPGHIIFVTHGMPAMELIEGLTDEKIRLTQAQIFLLPFNDRHIV